MVKCHFTGVVVLCIALAACGPPRSQTLRCKDARTGVVTFQATASSISYMGDGLWDISLGPTMELSYYQQAGGETCVIHNNNAIGPRSLEAGNG